MSKSIREESGPEWFCALLDTSPDVYFRYAPSRRSFVYLSPSVHTLTGRTPEELYANPSLCLTLVPRADRRTLGQVLRSRRALTLTLRVIRDGATIPIELRTVVVTHRRQVMAVEGVARLAAPAAREGRDDQASAPTQQRLAALMYEVHDLLHRVLPAAAERTAAAPRVQVGGLSFDHERLVVHEDGAQVALTSREVLLLRHFLQHSGQIVTRRQLLEDVWGYRYTGDDRTVDVHVSRLRRKLPSLRERLIAIRHVGYRLDIENTAKISNF